MEITINDKKFEIYTYDDKQSILERYANSLPNTLPIFLHIDSIDGNEVKGGEQIFIKNGSKLKISSVIDILNNTVNSDTNFTNFVRSLGTPSSLLRKNYDNFDYKPATYFFLLYLLGKTNFAYLKGPNKVELKTILDIPKLKLINQYVNKRFVVVNVHGDPMPNKEGIISISVIEDYYSEFLTKINELRIKLNTKVINSIRNFHKLDTIQPIQNKVSDFVTQSHTVNILLKTENKVNIDELFDNMDTSEEIPLIYLKKNNKLKIKVATNFKIPQIWLEELYLLENNKRIPPNKNYTFDISNDTLLKLIDFNYYLGDDSDDLSGDENIIYFKYSIFSFSKREKFENDPYIAELYSTNKIILSDSDILNINFTYQIPKGSKRFENKDFLNIFNKLIIEPNLEIIYIKDISIKGYFDIYDFTYNKTLIADFVDINPLSRFFMFINEFNKPIGDAEGEKQRFNIYFAGGHSYEINFDVVSFALLNKEDENTGDEFIKVNFTHARSTSQIEAVKNILFKLLNLYVSESSSLGKIYKSIVPSFVYEKQFTIIGKEKTYSRRLAKLKKEVPSLFRDISVYINQGNRQPIILSNEEYQTLRNDKYKGKKYYNRFLFFKKRWYTSLPLNPDNPFEEDVLGTKFPYIGLKCNPLKINVPKGKKGKVEVDNSKYAEEEPLIPACYESDQLKQGRNLSILQKYLEGIDPEDICKKEKKSKEFYILDPTKVLKINKMGEIPTTWNKIFDVFGVKKIESNKKQIYPVVRYGVGDFKDSIIRCLELAFNPLYQKKMLSKTIMSVEENNKIIIEARTKIANNTLNLIVGLQSTAPLNLSDIKKNLLDIGSYIDAASYIDILELHYRCNIFIYEYDYTGSVKIVIPNHLGGAYLTKKNIDKSLPIIVIMRTKVVCDSRKGSGVCDRNIEEVEDSPSEEESEEDVGLNEDEISENKVEEVFNSSEQTETSIYQCEILMKYSKPFDFKFNYESTDKRDIVGKIALDLFEKYKVYNF